MKEANELHPERVAEEFGNKIHKLITEYGPHLGGPDTAGILIAMATLVVLRTGATPELAHKFIADGFQATKEAYERSES